MACTPAVMMVSLGCILRVSLGCIPGIAVLPLANSPTDTVASRVVAQNMLQLIEKQLWQPEGHCMLFAVCHWVNGCIVALCAKSATAYSKAYWKQGHAFSKFVKAVYGMFEKCLKPTLPIGAGCASFTLCCLHHQLCMQVMSTHPQAVVPSGGSDNVLGVLWAKNQTHFVCSEFCFSEASGSVVTFLHPHAISNHFGIFMAHVGHVCHTLSCHREAALLCHHCRHCSQLCWGMGWVSSAQQQL